MSLCLQLVLLLALGRGVSRFPGVGVGGGFGVDAEIPDVEVHAFAAESALFAGHFDEGIFSGRQIFRGSEFEPASADAGDGGFDDVLFLADLAGDLALDVSHNALAAFDFGANDAEAIERNDRLLRLLRLLGLLRSLGGTSGIFRRSRLIRAIGSCVNIDVERRNTDVGLDGGVGAVEFNGLLHAGDGVDCAAKNVGLGVAADVSHGLLDFHDLRFSLKAVEKKHAGIVGQAKSGGDFGALSFVTFVLLLDFFVELGGFRDGGSGGAFSLVFFGGGPVDQRRGKFLPVIALGAHVTDAVAFHLVFRDELIRAVFEDEAAGEILSGGEARECTGVWPREGRGREDAGSDRTWDRLIIVWRGGVRQSGDLA